MNDQRQIQFLDSNEASLLVNAIPDLKHKCIVLLMLDCGLRVSEAISLQFGNFDFQKKILKVKSLKKRKAKDYSNRIVPLQPRLYNCLVDYSKHFNKIDDHTYLFPSPQKSKEHMVVSQIV